MGTGDEIFVDDFDLFFTALADQFSKEVFLRCILGTALRTVECSGVVSLRFHDGFLFSYFRDEKLFVADKKTLQGEKRGYAYQLRLEKGEIQGREIRAEDGVVQILF